jgi:hypothetical protein
MPAFRRHIFLFIQRLTIPCLYLVNVHSVFSNVSVKLWNVRHRKRSSISSYCPATYRVRSTDNSLRKHISKRQTDVTTKLDNIIERHSKGCSCTSFSLVFEICSERITARLAYYIPPYIPTVVSSATDNSGHRNVSEAISVANILPA